MRAVAIVAVLVGCTSARAVECEDGTQCPEGERCVIDVAIPETRCAPAASFAACEGLASGDACAGGTCFGGACIERRCGDRVVDRDEVCDDGNLADGDACSATCDSDETCGNGIADLSVGEQCDDDSPTLAGDGCARTCVAEYHLWRDVAPDAPALRADFGLATDPREGVVMFGGEATNALLTDTWRWTGSSWEAANVAYPDDGPSRRSRFAMAYDDVRHRVVLFGGNTGSDPAHANFRADTWEWDGLRWLDVSPPDLTTHPSPRSDATMACGGGRCILVGGTVNDPRATGCALAIGKNPCDAWSWDGTAWTELPAPPVAFRPRAHPAVAYDAELRAFVIFGGENNDTAIAAPLGDTWELGDDLALTNHTQAGPPATARPIASVDAHAVLLVSGTTAWAYSAQHAWEPRAAPDAADSPSIAADHATLHPVLIGQLSSTMFGVQAFSPDGATTWTRRVNAAPLGGPGSAAAAYDSARARTVVLDSNLGTLEWTGASWRQTVSKAASPPDVFQAALAYDATCGVTIAFGGRTVGGGLGDRTRAYDGASWSEVSPATSPSARWGHVMAYDPAHDALVLFGGSTYDTTMPGVVFGDTWVWSGATCATKSWKPLVTAGPSPSARRNAAFAYDARAQRLILFGGVTEDPAAPFDGETWQLVMTSATEGTWQQLAPATSPSTRAFHGMTTDPRRGNVVLFAGRSAADTTEQDTWELDGATWRGVATVTTPARRHSFALTYDVTGDVIAIGGANQGSAALAQLYRLSSENSLSPAERCLIATADDDGDGLAGCADPDCWGRCAPACGPWMSCAPGAPRCGDGTCDPTEDFLLCGDCTAP